MTQLPVIAQLAEGCTVHGCSKTILTNVCVCELVILVIVSMFCVRTSMNLRLFLDIFQLDFKFEIRNFPGVP